MRGECTHLLRDERNANPRVRLYELEHYLRTALTLASEADCGRDAVCSGVTVRCGGRGGPWPVTCVRMFLRRSSIYWLMKLSAMIVRLQHIQRPDACQEISRPSE